MNSAQPQSIEEANSFPLLKTSSIYLHHQNPGLPTLKWTMRALMTRCVGLLI